MCFALLEQTLIPDGACRLALGVEEGQGDHGGDEDAERDDTKEPFPPLAWACKSLNHEGDRYFPYGNAEHAQRTRYCIELDDIGELGRRDVV